MLKELDDCERLSRGTVLAGKVERGATCLIDTISLEKIAKSNVISTYKLGHYEAEA